MSDSFADLWSSSAPIPPKAKPQTLSTASASSSSSAVNRITTPNQPYRSTSSKPDVFALLAGSGSGSSSSSYGGGQQQQARYGSPNLTANGSNPSSRPISALGIQRSNSSTPAPPIAPAKSGSSGDAFSDLFSSASTKGSNGNGQAHSGMTLAARLAMEAQQRSQPNNSTPQTTQAKGAGVGDAWAGLDSLAGSGLGGLGGGSSISHKPKKPVKVDEEDDWGLGDFGASSSKPSPAAAQQQRASKQPPSSSQNQPRTLWALDDFSPQNNGASSTSSLRPPSQTDSISRSSSRTSQQRPRPPAEHTDSPDFDFDFGHREDGPTPPPPRRAGTGLLEFGEDETGVVSSSSRRTQRKGLLDSDDEGDTAGWGDDGGHDRLGVGEEEDDILGVLAKPVEVVRATSRTSSNSSNTQPPSRQTSNSASSISRADSLPRTLSPPPHILGQIVEMGFSISQAKKALARTSDGQDVQAALEMLLGGGGSAAGASTASLPSEREREREQQPPPSRTRGAPKGQKERERERQDRMRRENETNGSNSGPISADMQEQADKLLSQASEIGLSVLSKASAFWKEGKKKAVQVYEERAAGVVGGGSAAASGAGGSKADGRPKWMQDDVPGFKDDDAEETGSAPRRGQSAQHRQQPQQRQQHLEEEPVVDLFVDSPVSSNAARSSQLKSKPRQGSSSSFTPPAPIQRRPLTPPPVKNRDLPSASSGALSTAIKHKTAGTEQFKLGQYGTAAESYTLAINSLPAGHLLLVPLYTNRSLARIRTGEYKGAGEDAGLALVILVGEGGSEAAGGGLDSFDPTSTSSAAADIKAISWNPSLEPPSLLSAGQQKSNNGGWGHPQGVGVDLCDGFLKALRRRAEANEGRERWPEALKDWEVLTAGGWIPDAVKKEAARGAARCRKMVEGGRSASASTSTTSATPSAPKPRPKPSARPKPSSVPAAPSKALKSLQATNAQAEADDTLKHQLKDSVDAQLGAWRTGKETNIRALLASLDLVLWEELLKGVKVGGLHELVTPAQVKKGYVKAIARVHPDKLNAQNSSVEQRMLANGVFGTLNEAWIAFQGGK